MPANIALICPVFPPYNSSAAVQLDALASALISSGSSVTIFTPSPKIKNLVLIEENENLTIIRVKTPEFRDVSYIRRTLAELVVPYLLLLGILVKRINTKKFTGVIWYSPSIFFTPLVSYITKKSKCRNYLILRDIFPQWALDLELIKPGIFLEVFKFFELRQYKLADIIGVQSIGNLEYFIKIRKQNHFKIEVLNNWIMPPIKKGCSINLSISTLKRRKVFVYAGNMGVAQDLDRIFRLAKSFINRKDLGFLFVGRGSELSILRDKYKNLSNVLFCDEIPSEEMPSLYEKCFAGIVCLNEKHSTHNIPGKFISYLASGLPVLISVNPGNEIITIVKKNKVGIVASDSSLTSLMNAVNNILAMNRQVTSRRCLELYRKKFDPKKVASQILVNF